MARLDGIGSENEESLISLDVLSDFSTFSLLVYWAGSEVRRLYLGIQPGFAGNDFRSGTTGSAADQGFCGPRTEQCCLLRLCIESSLQRQHITSYHFSFLDYVKKNRNLSFTVVSKRS